VIAEVAKRARELVDALEGSGALAVDENLLGGGGVPALEVTFRFPNAFLLPKAAEVLVLHPGS
jgi:hypothetical protein